MKLRVEASRVGGSIAMRAPAPGLLDDDVRTPRLGLLQRWLRGDAAG